MDEIKIPVAPGELFDKISILEIKLDRIQEPDKRANVERECAFLTSIADALVLPQAAEVAALRQQLRAVNEEIWDAEDRVREHDRRDDFGPEFARVARTTYRNNDRRAALKRALSQSVGTTILEEKSHSSR